ncbi:MAG: flavodoxin family protein [Alphaproteobacteria bacterium]|jgi:multimeric flavodoxin WrbA|nr:flavodoxin family protein [Alphaproteobacteria bacterium]
MNAPLILGVSASLRNARSKRGSDDLVGQISTLVDREALNEFIDEQANIHVEQFLEAGRSEGLPFDELYLRLRKMGGHRGLSNSEVCLAAALWAAKNQGCDIENIALHDHFPADGEARDLDDLKERVMRADGILLSSPVYFGDRSSLSQNFIELLRGDPELREAMKAKIYAGLAVGAKRNGGQETTLIYQMLDFLNLGALAVGNDSETTSQYGGTAHAGDIGTVVADKYGIDTSLGTGRRIARVAKQMKSAEEVRLRDKPILNFWSLQDSGGQLGKWMQPLLDSAKPNADIIQCDLLSQPIRPCLACDICPIHVGPDQEYRCIIKRKSDGVVAAHQDLLSGDVIVPAVFSPVDRQGLETAYQEFMERSRYLRRGDYVFTDRLVAPLVIEEVGANENLDIRLMTSFIRHHTVMMKPIIGLIYEDKLINEAEVLQGMADAVAAGAKLAAGRLAMASLNDESVRYNPVGYVLSREKDNDPITMNQRAKSSDERMTRLGAEAKTRLETQQPDEKFIAS